MSKKRDRLEIIFSMLKVISEKMGNIRPTHIMYKANLSSQMLNEYLDELLEKSLIMVCVEKKKKTYKLTDKGYKFLKDYMEIRGFMDSYGLD